jgi:hypothetical protein
MSHLEILTHWFEHRKVKSAINFVRFAGQNIRVWEGSGLINRVFILGGNEKSNRIIFLKSRNGGFRK